MASSKITPLTEEEMRDWPKHPLVNLEKPFVDLRGSIQPLVDSIMKSAVMIQSKAGSLRANHYHKTDWHFIYVLKGSFKYYSQDLITKKKYRSLLVKKGELIFTPPKIIHATYFLENTEILALSKNLRDTKNYEKDTVRVELIDKKDFCIE